MSDILSLSVGSLVYLHPLERRVNAMFGVWKGIENGFVPASDSGNTTERFSVLNKMTFSFDSRYSLWLPNSLTFHNTSTIFTPKDIADYTIYQGITEIERGMSIQDNLSFRLVERMASLIN